MLMDGKVMSSSEAKVDKIVVVVVEVRYWDKAVDTS
jgi:hypothetical protein